MNLYSKREWGGTEIFRNPLVSFVYERGWRQGFSWAGFLGLEKETEIALRYLQPAANGVLLDVSCGSGLFTRAFLKSERFEQVVASDFSESMLRQTRQFLTDDPDLTRYRDLLLVRADVARLPFATASLDGVHAGAAIHCWPDPVTAAAEISRVLRPGGVFVGSTFLNSFAPLGELLGDETVRPLEEIAKFLPAGAPGSPGTAQQPYKWWSEGELKEVFAAAGLVNFQRTRSNRFILWSVTKPALKNNK